MAYQGKFDAKNQGQFPTATQRAAQKQEATSRRRSAQAAPQSAPKSSPQAQSPRQAAARPTAQRQAEVQKPSKKKQGLRTGTVIFYTVYALLIISFFGGMFFLTDWLDGWLHDYEAAQPTTKCEEIFQSLFADPDWSDLYDRSGIQATTYEGKDSFIAYMENKVGDTELTYQETSAGLSGDKKYFVKLSDETIGYFTLVGQKEFVTDIPDWQLGDVVIYHDYLESVTIQLMAGQTAYVNGVALDDSHTVQIGTTVAEKYLPTGVHGPRIYTQHLTGLMQEPVITVTDESGNSVNVSYNAEKDVYVAQTDANTISDTEKKLALETAKAYTLRMIEMPNNLSKYFDTSCESYKTITSINPWMQEWFYNGHEFGECVYSGYYRYADDLFSVHVKLPMYVTRTDNSVKEYTVDHTFFFEKQGGSWKCIIMTNVDVQEQKASVRLTFVSGEDVLLSEFFDANIKTLQTPTVTAPEGKVFSGWFREDIDENGVKTLTQVFLPDESGSVAVNTTLEPMTLIALFENAESEVAE